MTTETTSAPDTLPTLVSLAQVSGAKKQEVLALSEQIDVKDSYSIIAFGVEAQKELTTVSESMLEGVRNKDTGAAGGVLSDMLTTLRGFDVSYLKNGEEPGWFARTFLGKIKPVVRFVQQYESVKGQIESVKRNLEDHRARLVRDITMLDKLYEKTESYFDALELYILAAEHKLSELQETEIPALRKTAEETGDMADVQAVKDMEGVALDVERKISDLKLTRQVTMQSLPSIRNTQEVDKALVNKIQSTILNTIPLWQNQLAQAVTIANTKDAARATKEVNDLNNELLEANATNLREANREARTAIEQGVFSIEAVEKANGELIATIEESLQIADEGRAKRQDAEARLIECEKSLKESLLKAKAA